MAYFKLMLLKPIHQKRDDINIDSKYLINTISEFYSQETEYNNFKENLLNSKFSFCYTYNEKLSIHKHHQKELTFSLDQMILYNDQWITNPFAEHMLIGTKLCLEDKYGDQHLFTVKNISYTIKEHNRTLNVTCQDSFSYQMSRQNEGYEIINDSSSSDFIGSKTIDWWIYFKIQKECHIPYTYLPLYVGLYETTNNTIEIFRKNQSLENVKRIIKPIYDAEEYYETFPFSCSGSNANAALISIAETLGLMLNVYEHQTSDNQQFRKYYWVGPDKLEKNSGLYYSPNLDIQNFSFSQAGESLVTVLNVSGPTIDDEIITLIPDIPPFFLQYFNSDDWDKSEYYPGFYTNICQGETYSLLRTTDNDRGFEFLEVSGDTKTIVSDADLLIPIKLPNIPRWYDKVSFAGSELEIGFGGFSRLFYPEESLWSIYVAPENLTNSQRNALLTLLQQEDTYTCSSQTSLGFVKNKKYWIKQDSKFYCYTCTKVEKTELMYFYSFTRVEKIWDESIGKISDQIFTMDDITWELINCGHPTYLLIDTTINDLQAQYWIASVKLYMRWFRDVSADDLNFASIADQCPWLENKLINFDYFLQHKLITPNDKELLNTTLTNNLRKINGRLMQHTKSYYQALHTRTTNIAELTNSFDLLGAEMESAIFSRYAKEGDIKDTDFSSLYNTYNAIWKLNREVQPILDYNELITEYFNKYFNAQQRFLKNIYNFRKYWNEPISFAGTGIYTNKITIRNFNDDTDKQIILFNDLKWEQVNESFSMYDKNKLVPTVKLYTGASAVEEVTLVHKDNYINFYIPTIKKDQWIKCNDNDYLLSDVFYVKDDSATEQNGRFTLNNPEQQLYSDIVANYLRQHASQYYIRETPYYNSTSEWFLFKINSKKNPLASWTEDNDGTKRLKKIYNQEVLSKILTSYNLSKGLSLSETGGWDAEAYTSFDDDGDIVPEKDETYHNTKWSEIIESYMQGFPVDSLYWKGCEQKGSNEQKINDSIAYYTTWKDADETEKYLPVAYVTPQNESSYFRRVNVSNASYWAINITAALFTPAMILQATMRYRKGKLAQNGITYRVLDNNKVHSETSSNTFSNGQSGYINWLKPIYSTDKNGDALIEQYLNIADKTINDYYKFWKWIGPTYANFNNKQHYWWNENSFDTDSLMYKDIVLRPLHSSDVINYQDKYIILPIEHNTDDCIFNLTNFTSSNIGFQLVQCCLEDSNVISSIIHYPLYNASMQLNFEFNSSEGHTWSELSNFTDGLASEDYIWSDRNMKFTIYTDAEKQISYVFFQVEDFKRKEIESDKIDDLVKNKTIYSKTTHLPVNFYSIKGVVSGLFRQSKKDSNYVKIRDLIDLQTETEVENNELVWNLNNPDTILYKGSQENFYKMISFETQTYTQVYSIQKYISGSFSAFYQTSTSFSETVFTTDVKTITPPLFLATKNIEDTNITINKVEKYNKTLELDFDLDYTEKNPKIITIRNDNNVEYKLSYSCSQEQIETFKNDSNGTFWYKYHSYNESHPLIFEYAAMIETQLTQYWTSAYANSQYIEYFIPEFWQRVGSQSINYFSSDLITWDETADRAILNDKFIPIVSLLTDKTTRNSVLPRYQLTYFENITDFLNIQKDSSTMYADLETNQYFVADKVLGDNVALLKAFNEIGWTSEDLKHWQAEKIGEGNFGQTYYYVNDNTGKKRSTFPQEISKALLPLDNYNGLYIMLTKYLSQYYTNESMSLYRTIQKQRDDLWHTIYQEYPGLLLEGSYTSEDATNSKDLLFLAKNAFRDLSSPERNYSLTLIDAHSLKGYIGQQLDIGDSIQLDVNEYVDKYGDLSQALSQYLFISDISYDLRKDNDINLTVNTIKYQDKLIQRLVKLIR